MHLKIAQVKIYPEKGNLAKNHAALMSTLTEIVPHQPDVVVTPECFLDGYVVTEEHVQKTDMAQYAINPAQATYVLDVKEWAAAQKSWLIYGCTRQTSDGVYNTALIMNRAGDIVGHYDKTHCQTHDFKFLPGENLPVFDSDFGVFGVMICADRRWPETVRTLAVKGAQIIFNPTYGMHDDRNLHMMQTRSYESETIIVFTHPGQALITDARGNIIQNDEAPDHRFAITEIDLSSVEAVRTSRSAHLRDRRTDLYL
ncbi:MAG: carbon-nitrogen hydrolase family protein [Chloroflexota bacterium]